MCQVIVSVPTYKRPKRLRYLLGILQKQVIPENVELKILVIDNDCSGDVSEVVRDFSSSVIPVYCVTEPQKGIVFARNRIAKEFLASNADFLIFIDDDEWPAKDDWILQLLKTQQETGADIVTGPVIRIPEDSSSLWFKNIMDGIVSNRHGMFQVKKFYTNNLLLTMRVVSHFNIPFDSKFNMTGSSDLHFSVRCRKAGFKAVYSSDCAVYELLFRSRLNVKWFFLRGYRSGIGSTMVSFIEDDLIMYSVFKSLLYSFLRGGRAFFTLVLAVILFNRGIFMLGVNRLGSSIGSFTGIFGVNYNEYKITHGS
jgi:succinoglycan biosynthesis protein ExoM